MPSRPCSRCHTVLHREDEGSLVFCWNCGAPQVLVSAELLEQAAQAATEPAVPDTPAARAARTPSNPVVWRGAVRYTALAGAIAAGLSLISFVLPPVSLLSFFWAISAPIIVLGIYSARFKQARITTGFAARLGLLCGLAMLLAYVCVHTAQICLLRYAFHAAVPLDSQIAFFFAQETSLITARMGAAEAAPALRMFTVPEYRAGILLGLSGFLAVLYLLFSMTAGAFAGFLRSRAR